MFNFNSKKAEIFRTVDTPFFIQKASKIKIFSLWVFLFFFGIYLLGVFQEEFRFVGSEPMLGGVLFFFFLFLLFWYVDLFFETKLKRPPIDSLEEASTNIEEVNLAEYFDYQAAKMLQKTIDSKHANSSFLLYHILKECSLSQFVFSRILLDKGRLINSLESWLDQDSDQEMSKDLKKTISLSLQEANKSNHKRIRPGDLLVALAKANSFFEQKLIQLDLQPEDIKDLVDWYIRLDKKDKKKKRFWKYENLIKKGAIGRDWIAGATYLLDQFSIDWTNQLRRAGFRKTIGHEKEIESAERILGSSPGNVVLVGKPGIGRKSVVDEITRKIFLGISEPSLNDNRVLKINMQSLIAQVEGRESTEKVLDNIFQEAVSAGNVIIVLEGFHEFVAGEKGVGVVDISGVLDPYLNNPDFKFIAVTNYKSYRRIIEKNQPIKNNLEKIELEEPSKKETIQLCELITPSLEKEHEVFVSYPALKASVDYSGEFLTGESFPEKALDLLEESVVAASQEKGDQKVLRREQVAELVTEKSEVPVGQLENEEKEKLLNLEEKAHERVINQHEAISEVAKSLRRSRANIDTRASLIGSFLFLGPTGVGKTETAKTIADIYFGSEDKIIRLDMSEYQNISDLSRLIGSEERDGILTEKVLEDPFSLVLLDELEKAHKDILNVFLQVLDEGHITDGVGRQVSFKNCIVIATSNAGYKMIMNAVEDEIDLNRVKDDILDHLFNEGIFRPEFVNRFDATVLFEPLSKDNLMEIAELQLKQLQEDLSDKHIDLEITEELKEKIVEISYEPMFGAREMQRVIQNKIGDTLASAILSDKISGGSKVRIDPEDFTLKN